LNLKIRHTKCSIDDLIVGNDFQFRVTAFNECGLGEGTFTKDFATIEKEILVYTKPVYPEKDNRDAPQFTMGLNNRKLTLGYSGTLTCSVRGHPKPKIRWFKNKGTYKIFVFLRHCSDYQKFFLNISFF